MESGAGKEVIARYVHQNSQRNKKIFLPVNCAAIPHELMESEFFGYEKGLLKIKPLGKAVGLFELVMAAQFLWMKSVNWICLCSRNF